jgi:hypothetical protein
MIKYNSLKVFKLKRTNKIKIKIIKLMDSLYQKQQYKKLPRDLGMIFEIHPKCYNNIKTIKLHKKN